MLPGCTIVLSRSTYLFPDAQSSPIGARIFFPMHNRAPTEHDYAPPLHNRALGEHESFFRSTIMLRAGIIVSSRSTIVIVQGTKVHGQHDRMYREKRQPASHRSNVNTERSPLPANMVMCFFNSTHLRISIRGVVMNQTLSNTTPAVFLERRNTYKLLIPEDD